MVTTGLEQLLNSYLSIVEGKRVGIITNPSGVTRDLIQNVDALVNAKVNLTAIFAPEHGFRAAAKEGESIDSYTDAKTGIPVFSLYGNNHKPSPEMLSHVDVVIIDMQDSGARFYTFISTLLDTAEACIEENKTFIVLDRPNPINGNQIEGSILDMNFRTFVGYSPIPIRYGLTQGELARFYNAQFNLGMKEYIAGVSGDYKGENLVIIPMKDWARSMWYDQTGLAWIPPSPNFATLETAIVFPGMCFIEGTNLSEGRGTVRPFEWVGAPYIDADLLTDYLNEKNLPGMKFRHTFFTPFYSKNEKKVCHGIQVHVLDRNQFIPTLTGLHVLYALNHLFSNDFEWIKYERFFIDNLLGSDRVRTAISSGVSIETVWNEWVHDSEQFKEIRKPFLIYS